MDSATKPKATIVPKNLKRVMKRETPLHTFPLGLFCREERLPNDSSGSRNVLLPESQQLNAAGVMP